MRIKRLELFGFKSCMDRTVLEFPAGITGVVGPNGCGKSNIVDALRWVLGEQSARHLRGKAMEDVIFAGNDRFAPLGMAEVTIVLDNDDPPPEESEFAAEFKSLDLGTDPDPGVESGEASAGAGSEASTDAKPEANPEDEASAVVAALRKVPEIQITRRLYRSGESEYLINNQAARLRDITELFLGTGVGTKAYSMIEQGRVGQIVNAKPDELRLFIEEAAGTTLYRSRKLAAERKIDRTRDNLLRVNDIVRELERQAGSLRRQAKGAQAYQELKDEELSVDRKLTSFRLRKVDDRAAQMVESLTTLRSQVEELTDRISEAAENREAKRAELRHAEAHAEEVRRGVYESRARVGEIEQSRRFLEGRLSEIAVLLNEAGAELEDLKLRRDQELATKEEVERERATLAQALEEVANERRRVEAELATQENTRRDWELEAERLKSDVIDSLAAEASLKNEKSGLLRELEGLRSQIARLDEETVSLAAIAKTVAGQVEESTESLQATIATLAETEGGKDSAARGLEASLAHQAESERRAQAERENLRELQSRLTSLKELHEGFTGYADGVRAFMSNGGRERAGASAVVADVVDIEAGYERAFAAVLQDRLQYVVVPDQSAGMIAASYLRETGTGRASFIPRQPRTHGATDVPPGSSLLADHLSVTEGYEAVVEPLIDGIVVSDSLEEAGAQWAQNGYEATFVTLSGEVINAQGIVTGGSGTPLDEGLLTRKAEMRVIAQDLAAAEDRNRAAAATLADAVAEAASVRTKVAGLDTKLHELTVEKVAIEGELELRRQNLARTKERMVVIEAERRSFVESLTTGEERLASVEVQLEERTVTSSQLEDSRRLNQEQGRALDEERQTFAARVEDVRVREAELRQKRENVELRLRTAIATAADFTSRLEVVAARRTRDEKEAEASTARLQEPAMDPASASVILGEREAELQGLDEQVLAMRGAVEVAESDIGEMRSQLDDLRNRLSEAELGAKEAELERASLDEGVKERLGISADELVAQGEDIAEFEESSAVANLDAIRRRIRRLGTVNLGAVIELEEVESRLTDLVDQRDDLERSVEDLRGTIARLNKLSKDRFKETFDCTNEIFQATFPKLFRGGTASMSLTDPGNLLETGVEIHVQPPGKKPGNLDLLSGGEKALTAISLIFSLFLFKPSPFCVLDEVDAPLDEANVGRFIQMVVDMCGRSQFLLITHSKRTMEACDILYGVTMPQPGVSKIVSVDLAA